MPKDLQIFSAVSVKSPLIYGMNVNREATALMRLSQRVILRLLTPKGSAYGQPDFGTDFVRDILQGRYASTTAVERAFSVTRLDLLRQSAEDEFDDDSTLKDVKLLSVIVQNDQVDLQISVVSQAGSTGVFSLAV